MEPGAFELVALIVDLGGAATRVTRDVTGDRVGRRQTVRGKHVLDMGVVATRTVTVEMAEEVVHEETLVG